MKPLNAPRLLIVAVVAVIVCAMLCGCTVEDRAALTQQAVVVREHVDAAEAQIAAISDELANADEAIALLPEGKAKDEARAYKAGLEDALTRTQAVIAQGKVVLDEIAAGLADSGDAFDVAQVAITAAGKVAPPPWGALGAGLAGLVLGLIRAAYNRAAGRRVIASVDGYVMPSEPGEAAKLSVAQGAGGKRLVDEAQGKKLALPF